MQQMDVHVDLIGDGGYTWFGGGIKTVTGPEGTATIPIEVRASVRVWGQTGAGAVEGRGEGGSIGLLTPFDSIHALPTPTDRLTNQPLHEHQHHHHQQVRVPSYYGGTLSMHAFLTPQGGTFEQRVATAEELEVRWRCDELIRGLWGTPGGV